MISIRFTIDYLELLYSNDQFISIFFYDFVRTLHRSKIEHGKSIH
jgi:hypothetical protein